MSLMTGLIPSYNYTMYSVYVLYLLLYILYIIKKNIYLTLYIVHYTVHIL